MSYAVLSWIGNQNPDKILLPGVLDIIGEVSPLSETCCPIDSALKMGGKKETVNCV